jgi:membrane peptidoglycan carboxypeptidase
VELARFQQEARRVVSYDEVPQLVLDATTTAEDRTFWDNQGFDPAAIVSAVAGNLSGETDRGASTITQQLIRARLLPDAVTAPGADRYARKVLEIIQSARVTQAFPGEAGKERIITAYLNQIYYGHQAYGVAAAAKIYFGVDDLSKLTTAQSALLAALPKAPSQLDPYQYATADADGHLVVDPMSPPVVRRNWILQNLSTSRGTHLTQAQVDAAINEPVVLAGDPESQMLAPHFVWQVRRQLENLLGGATAVETGGYKVITTLDWNVQQLAQRWVTAAVITPNLGRDQANDVLNQLEIPGSDRTWINALRGKDLHNAAMVAMDYRTGDVLGYIGSAGYDRDDMASPKFSPKFDAAGDGARQPGSAFKPILYSTAFENNVLTPGSLLLDVTTEFDKKAQWAPRDADQLERGPVLVRNALQYSLNIPAIRAYQRVGGQAVADMTDKLGMRMQGGRKLLLEAGLAAAIGTVEVRPLDLLSGYAAIANGGKSNPPRMILSVTKPDGTVDYEAPKSAGSPAMSPQSAFLVTDILAGNTDPSQNPIWSAALELKNGPDGQRRPAAVKTGTANEAKDLATYGFLAPPDDPSQPAFAVGLWMGNSDHSTPDTSKPATSLTAAAPLWHAFVRDLTAGSPVTGFNPPDGVHQQTIDAWSGGKPGPWTKDTKVEWFKDGTGPDSDNPVDPAGLLYSNDCGGWRVDPVKAELGLDQWKSDVADWLRRARQGTGVSGQYDSKTAYFWGRSGWGGSLAGSCSPTSTPSDQGGDNGNGNGGDNGGGGGSGGGTSGGGTSGGGGGTSGGGGHGRKGR